MIHSLNVVDGHKVETEAVDVEFVGPILHRFGDVAAYHRTLRGGFVAATRGVGVVAILILTVVVAGCCEREVGAVVGEGVVVDNVHNHTDAGLVESLHHLFHFTNADLGAVGVGGVAALGHVVVFGIIAPVVFILLQTALVNRTVVVGGEDVHVGDAKLLEVVDTAGQTIAGAYTFLGQCEELTLVLDAAVGGNGEVAVVHLVDYDVGEVLHLYALVVFPTLGVGVGQVDDGCTLTVDTYGFVPHAGGFVESLACLSHLIGIELALLIALYRGHPSARRATLHRDGLESLTAQTFGIDAEGYGICRGSPQTHSRLFGGVGESEVTLFVLWIGGPVTYGSLGFASHSQDAARYSGKFNDSFHIYL